MGDCTRAKMDANANDDADGIDDGQPVNMDYDMPLNPVAPKAKAAKRRVLGFPAATSRIGAAASAPASAVQPLNIKHLPQKLQPQKQLLLRPQKQLLLLLLLLLLLRPRKKLQPPKLQLQLQK